MSRVLGTQPSSILLNLSNELDMETQVYNPSTWEAERSHVQGQPKLHRETLSQKSNKNKSLLCYIEENTKAMVVKNIVQCNRLSTWLSGL